MGMIPLRLEIRRHRQALPTSASEGRPRQLYERPHRRENENAYRSVIQRTALTEQTAIKSRSIRKEMEGFVS